MLKLKLQYFGHFMRRVDSLERPWCWEGLGAGGEGDNREWDGWMISPTRWTWVWVNSRSWWWTGRPGVLRFMGLQKVGHNWATELNWILIRFEIVTMNIFYLWNSNKRKKKNNITWNLITWNLLHNNENGLMIVTWKIYDRFQRLFWAEVRQYIHRTDATRAYHTKWSESKKETNIIWYPLNVKSKIWHKQTYLQNRNRITDMENRFVVSSSLRGRRGMDWEFGDVNYYI